MAAVAGIADFTSSGVYANLIGNKVIRVTKALTAGSAQMTLNTNSFTVVHAPASQFVVANPTDANVGDTVTAPDAEEIARRWNAHAGLVEAMQEAAEWCEQDRDNEDGHPTQEMLEARADRLRSALKAAGA